MIIDANKIHKKGALNLKGHVKLTLTDANTGEVNKTVEGDNVITDAVADILRLNLLGCTDASKILGADGLYKKWFGGILCYEQTHASLDAGDYFITNSQDNPVTAHAGQTAIDPDHDDDFTRGNPLTSSYIRTGNSIKLVWQWGTTQGNGVIRSLALTHTDTGSFGLGSDAYHFINTFTPWDQIQNDNIAAIAQNPRAAGNAFVQYDDNHTLFFYIGVDTWYNNNASVPDGEEMIDQVTVYVRRLPYNKTGLFDVTTGTTEATDTRKFTVTTSIGFKYNPAYYFDPTTKYLWLFNNFTYTVPNDYGSGSPVPPHTRAREWSRNTVYYTVIDCETETEIDSGTIVSNADDLAFLECSADGSLGTRMYYGARVIHQNILIDNDYIYLPMGESETHAGQGYNTKQNFIGFKKINLSDQTDQTAIVFSDTSIKLGKYYCAVKQGDFIVGFGYVVNGEEIYRCNVTPFVKPYDQDYNYSNVYMNELSDQPVIYTPTRPQNEGATATARYIFASKLVNTSKFDLPSAVQKYPNQTMTVEYTITEAGEES